MKTTVIGAFPKISDDPGGQELPSPAEYPDADRGEIDAEALDQVFDSVTREAIAELESAGIDVINDGHIRWDDLFAPFARAWDGVARGPLERFYDNNTYFRQPVIERAIGTSGRTLVRDFELARATTKKQLKAAVCGPLSFATLTAEDRAYKTLEERTLAVADALAAEIRGLGAAGATLVDVEDPAVVARPELIGLARAAYERLATAKVPLAIQPYFFPADRVLEQLATFPVAQVGIDLCSRDTDALAALGALRTRTVVLGVVDARNTRLETEAEVAKTLEAAAKVIGADRVWAAPTTGLEFLPHGVASKKLAVLVKGARAAMGVPA
jgi:5-methyltetrahydropteroyltriglutamate--homocysteine methyltransferase